MPGDNDVLGYITQCEICGQRCITRTVHVGGYVCPLCTLVTAADDAESSSDDFLPIEKVR